jgi:hypothetical protein
MCDPTDAELFRSAQSISIKSYRGFCILNVRDRGPGLPHRPTRRRNSIQKAFAGESQPGVPARMRFPINGENRLRPDWEQPIERIE